MIRKNISGVLQKRGGRRRGPEFVAEVDGLGLEIDGTAAGVEEILERLGGGDGGGIPPVSSAGTCWTQGDLAHIPLPSHPV